MKVLWIYILFFFLVINVTVLIKSQTKKDKELKTSSMSRSKKSADSLFDLGVKNQDNGNFSQSLIFFEESLISQNSSIFFNVLVTTTRGFKLLSFLKVY